MSVPNLTICPATLAENHVTYSALGLRRVFNGRKVNHILRYDSPAKNDEDAEKFIENRERLSISGVLEKMSLILEGNKLRLTEADEQGNLYPEANTP